MAETETRNDLHTAETEARNDAYAAETEARNDLYATETEAHGATSSAKKKGKLRRCPGA